MGHCFGYFGGLAKRPRLSCRVALDVKGNCEAVELTAGPAQDQDGQAPKRTVNVSSVEVPIPEAPQRRVGYSHIYFRLRSTYRYSLHETPGNHHGG